MTIFKRLLNYLIWTLICFLAGFAHMRIITGFMKMFDWVYGVALIQVGAIIGGIIAALYILLDIFYLRKKLNQRKNVIGLRLLIIIGIAILVGVTHYVLEEVVDVI